MNSTKLFKFVIAITLILFISNVQAQSLKGLREKAKKEAQKKLNNKKKSNSSNSGKTSSSGSSSGSSSKDIERQRMERSQSSTSSSSRSSSRSSANSQPAANSALAQKANYYKTKGEKLHDKLETLSQIVWDKKKLMEIKEFNFPEFYKTMEADKAKHPQCFKIYPSKLPNSGYNTMTKQNVDQFADFGVAPETELPPSDPNEKIIADFYKNYSYWKLVMKNRSNETASTFRSTLTRCEQKPENFRFDDAVYCKQYARAIKDVCPDNGRVDDLIADADEFYRSTLESIKGLISGPYHKSHLKQMVLFSKKPKWGSESDNDLVQEIKIGEPVWLTGYFATTNKMGLPTLLLMDNNKPAAQASNCWERTAYHAHIPTFNQLEHKAEYKPKAYYTFNLFPDVETTNYKSHVQYFPHLNFIKFLTYQPSEVLEFKVRWGKTQNMSEGIIKIDLSGDNKAKLKEYYKKLEQKRLSMVTYPDMCGTVDATASIINFSDLSKYGKVLRITMRNAGNIMKPWPNDDQVDWNTAKGFMAVEKENGKVIIMPLDFRKRPGAGKWQWWSIGTFPDLFPAMDFGFTEFNAVKKIDGGYEILKENVNKSSTWYVEQ